MLACLLWENQFYEDGVEIASRIAELVPRVEAAKVAALAVEAREQMKLRHAPLLLVREMARLCDASRARGRDARAGDPACRRTLRVRRHLLGTGRQPLSAQVKKGLAAAFRKFDEYALAKYDRANPVKLRDVLFLAHAKPRDEAQAALWKQLAEGELRRRTPGRLRSPPVPTSARRGSACSVKTSSELWPCCATCATWTRQASTSRW